MGSKNGKKIHGLRWIFCGFGGIGRKEVKSANLAEIGAFELGERKLWPSKAFKALKPCIKHWPLLVYGLKPPTKHFILWSCQ